VPIKGIYTGQFKVNETTPVELFEYINSVVEEFIKIDHLGRFSEYVKKISLKERDDRFKIIVRENIQHIGKIELEINYENELDHPDYFYYMPMHYVELVRYISRIELNHEIQVSNSQISLNTNLLWRLVIMIPVRNGYCAYGQIYPQTQTALVRTMVNLYRNIVGVKASMFSDIRRFAMCQFMSQYQFSKVSFIFSEDQTSPECLVYIPVNDNKQCFKVKVRISGHAINMMAASNWFNVDMDRHMRQVTFNLFLRELADSSATYKYAYENGLLAERHSQYGLKERWHSLLDYLPVPIVYEALMTFMGQRINESSLRIYKIWMRIMMKATIVLQYPQNIRPFFESLVEMSREGMEFYLNRELKALEIDEMSFNTVRPDLNMLLYSNQRIFSLDKVKADFHAVYRR